MNTGSFFQNVKQKVHSAYDNFFYRGMDAPAPVPMEQGADAAAQADPAQPPRVSYQQSAGYQQPVGYQQLVGYQQPAGYQQPTGYQQPQTGYQQPIATPQVDLSRQGGRTHRASQRAASNVVELDRYQAQQPAAAPQPVQPPQPPQETAGQNTWVINVRGMGDCCSAITLLRGGGAVLTVMENITDPAELHRLVDTLSGACYSLTATITKLSRNGVYLLAPKNVAVYTDQATKMMNSAGSRTYSYQQQPLSRQGAAPAASQQAAAPQQREDSAVSRQQGYARQVSPSAAAPSFYARSVPQEAAVPSFTAAESSGSGYRPDDLAAGGY